MVVLSACDTGFGKLYRGEGAMSLAKAFTYAGSPSVVMNQWKADDEAPEEIIKYFYQNLADGKRKDEALREAKLTFFNNVKPHQLAPAFWNNFVVTGDVRPIIGSNTSHFIIWITVSALILLVLLVLVLKKNQILN